MLSGLGMEPAEAIERLRRFATMLIQWNREVSNLISGNDEPRIVTRHLRESVEPAAWLAQAGARRWVDFGSGAGFPALPLVLLGVGEHWTLVESRRPKTLFLRKAIQELELRHVEVFHGRLESLAAERPDRAEFDGFTSRATLRLVPTLEIAERYLASGGYAFLWKGSRRAEELAQDSEWKAKWELQEIREIGAENTAVVKLMKQ